MPIAARLAQVAEYVEVANRVGGVEAAKELARERRGEQFDPVLADVVVADGRARPLGPRRHRDVGRRDRRRAGARGRARRRAVRPALFAIANFVDLKSPYFLGHAGGVADLVAEAGAQLGLADDEVLLLRGPGSRTTSGGSASRTRSGTSAAPLGRRRVGARAAPAVPDRAHAATVAGARASRRIAVQHRERLDGSGYPQGLSGSAISAHARILGAADAYQAMREPRPHRPALSADQAAAELRADVKAGRYDPDAVEAVLGAAGHRVVRRRGGPAGLTPREVEVLRLLARGLSNKEIAARLTISPKTVGNHVEHIYAKIDATTRTAAGLFAMQHGLLPEEEFPARVAV